LKYVFHVFHVFNPPKYGVDIWKKWD